MNLSESQISSELVYDGSFIVIQRDQVRLPNGNESQRIVVRHPGAACILAVTDQEEVVFVRQWRYALGEALLELPAGKLEAGEDPAVCALRELEEETPYRAERVELMRTFFTAPGFCDEKMYVYRAVGVQAGSRLQPDQDEFVESVLLNKAQVREALQSGEISDAKTIVALQDWLAE